MRHQLLFRAMFAPVLNALYRPRVVGREKIPAGPVILVANHITASDPALLVYAAKRPLRFWQSRKAREREGIWAWVTDGLGAIPIHPGDTRSQLEEAITLAKKAIQSGQSFVVFAEGDVTSNGNLLRFRRGFDRLAEQTGVPVVPVHIDGMWGSLLSRQKGRSLWSHLRELPRPVTVRFGDPLPESNVQAARDAVQLLGAESLGDRISGSAKTLPRAFLHAAKRFWSRPAVADTTGTELSYGKALTGSIVLAGELKKRIAGERVGILLPPSVGGALANVAVNILGKIPVNLNYTAGKEGMGYAIEKAQLVSVVTSRKFIEALRQRGLELPEADYVYLEDVKEAIPGWKKVVTAVATRLLPARASEAIFMRSAPKSLDDTATVLFTSGSSGKPKGVELTHKNIQANVEMVREVFPYSARHTILGALPFFHSFGFTVTLWSSLLQGQLAAYHNNPLETKVIAELAAKYHPTILLSTPTFLMKYAQRVPAEAFAGLQFVVAGAEKLRKEVADAFQKKFGVRPLEGYGATELSPVASGNLPDHPRQPGGREGSVGHPMPGSAVRVVDPETFKPLPWGSEGLLLVKGAHVMKGYLKDPDKTREALRDGWYVTGDIAVVDRDGFITLKGRLSRFSKIAGEMVSHVAVEEKLQQASGLTDMAFVVVGVPDSERGERLAVVYAGYEGSIEELTRKMREAGAPNLWIPTEKYFYKVDSIPVLGTGKVDIQTVKKIVAARSP